MAHNLYDTGEPHRSDLLLPGTTPPPLQKSPSSHEDDDDECDVGCSHKSFCVDNCNIKIANDRRDRMGNAA